VTAHPTAEWVARQLTEVCGWDWTPSFIARDRDSVYGEILPGGFGPWAFVTGRLHPARHGKTGMRNGRLARSGGNALTISPTAPKNQQTIKKSKGNRWTHKEIHRGNARGMIAQERPPSLRWRFPVSCHILWMARPY
jgi:hypothetical protein